MSHKLSNSGISTTIVALVVIVIILGAAASYFALTPTVVEKTTTKTVTTSVTTSITSTTTREILPVKIGAFTFVAFPQYFIALQKGYFIEEGLKISHEVINSGSRQLDALLAGETEIAMTSMAEPIKANIGGKHMFSFFSMENVMPYELFLSNNKIEDLAKEGITPDSPLQDRLAALKGMTIGSYPAGSLVEALIRDLTVFAGYVPLEDVKIQYVGFGTQQVAALKANLIDGAYLAGYYFAIIDEAEAGVLFIKADELRQAGLTAQEAVFEQVTTTEDYAKENPEVVKRLAAGLLRGTQLMLDNPEEAAKALAEYEPRLGGIPESREYEWLIPMLQTYAESSPDGRVSPQSTQIFVDMMIAGGMVNKDEITFDLSVLWSYDYLPE